MSRVVSPFIAAVLVLAIVLGGCGGYSENHRRGLVFGGGAAVFIGGIVALDGLSCSGSVGGDNGTSDCDEDKGDLIRGGALLGAGLVIAAIGLLVKPKPANGNH